MKEMDIGEIKKYFDQKLEELTSKALELKAKKPIVLNKKGNQIQFDHCSEVLNLVQAAENHLKSDNKIKVEEKLTAARKSLESRIKLIRIADKSEFGWVTVEEYVCDDVADDSGDERKIRMAENRAEQKRKKE